MTASPSLPTPLALRSAQERTAEQLAASNAAFSIATQELAALRIENAAIREQKALLEARIEQLLATPVQQARVVTLARTPFFEGDPTVPQAPWTEGDGVSVQC